MSCRGIPVIEPVPIQDEFVSGIHKIELVGTSCVRFYLYSDHTAQDGSEERLLISQIVMPLDCLSRAVRKTLRFMNSKSVEVERRPLERLLS